MDIQQHVGGHFDQRADPGGAVTIVPTFDGWRAAARTLLQADIDPQHVVWREALSTSPAQHAHASLEDAARVPRQRVSRDFIKLARRVACHRDPSRWALLYRVLWRLTHGEPNLLRTVSHDISALGALHLDVRRDMERTLARLRFRAMEATVTSPVLTHVAWTAPEHHVVPAVARLLMRRMPDLRWSILTPDRSSHWNGSVLLLTDGVDLVAPDHRQLAHFWRTGYGAKVAAAELQANHAAALRDDRRANAHARRSTGVARVPAAVPVDVSDRYWHALSEAKRIPSLTPSAASRDWQSRAPIARAPLERSGGTGVNSAQLLNDAGQDFDVPGAWDPVHDPGVRAARERAAAVRLHAPEGLTLLGSPVRIGTGAWAGPTIAQPGVFYPSEIATPEARLTHYASHFSLAEIGTTFSALPSRAMTAAWAAASPDGFVFDVQVYALLTGHSIDTRELPTWLRESLPMSLSRAARVETRDLPVALLDEVWRRFLGALEPLREAGKLGAILMRFSRDFAPSAENFQALALIRERLGHASAAVEFHHPAWTAGRTAPRTFALLERLRLTYVIVDSPTGLASSLSSVVQITTPELAIVRMLGRRRGAWEARGTLESERCRYLYDRDELTGWASRISAIAGKLRIATGGVQAPVLHPAQGVHVLLDNCHANYATTNAEEMTELLIEADQERLELWS
ncbi:MAG TPA: DUF4130 domain-containing protein [Gemmatimonas sp.]|nr:DUF4130 domain-containing protein [Gemmatimonas sp.]